jgi:hypothetical protein
MVAKTRALEVVETNLQKQLVISVNKQNNKNEKERHEKDICKHG